MNNMKVYFDGQLECGAFIKSASVTLPNDYTMNQLVQAIKSRGFINFKTESMKILVDIK